MLTATPADSNRPVNASAVNCAGASTQGPPGFLRESRNIHEENNVLFPRARDVEAALLLRAAAGESPRR